MASLVYIAVMCVLLCLNGTTGKYCKRSGKQYPEGYTYRMVRVKRCDPWKCIKGYFVPQKKDKRGRAIGFIKAGAPLANVGRFSTLVGKPSTDKIQEHRKDRPISGRPPGTGSVYPYQSSDIERQRPSPSYQGDISLPCRTTDRCHPSLASSITRHKPDRTYLGHSRPSHPRDESCSSEQRSINLKLD
ncbi:hypothetical protein PoB_007090200 [Plakobranchus ocellatus]|uniref:Uncharacterized protein n=1 Tax=Plakobranchus ocellatus TaxID=259542 RepID=A0AAV4DJE4_9GAST|nr:hypothetical protein PoB_007090200 [Plakobranchus ocellatus]